MKPTTPEVSPSPSVPKKKLKLTFPAEVLTPQKTQHELSKDEVADEVRKLCDRAQHLGSKLGVPMRGFDIGEAIKEKADTKLMKPNEGLLLMCLLVMAENMEGKETLSLEPRHGSWGIFYNRSAGSTGRPAISVPLVDAPLAVRLRFCEHSFRFFEEYLANAGLTLRETKTAAESARRTLEALDNIERQ